MISPVSAEQVFGVADGKTTVLVVVGNNGGESVGVDKGTVGMAIGRFDGWQAASCNTSIREIN